MRLVEPAATELMPAAVPPVPPLAAARPDLPPGSSEAVEQAPPRETDARQGSVAELRARLIDEDVRPVDSLPSAA
ncbi:MAG: hypothetical protein V7607_3858 [Solirubrobacteraceae bacterium]